MDINIPHNGITIPILDDEISPSEVENHIKAMKGNKAPGPDGLTSNILKC